MKRGRQQGSSFGITNPPYSAVLKTTLLRPGQKVDPTCTPYFSYRALALSDITIQDFDFTKIINIEHSIYLHRNNIMYR